ncbi:uncharacterized protein LOC133328037 [Musca vetustissima]|uniref:uncharacterized protein LOC133328037 n=1 Tax=Musca vetustissima TaxID=27455 RepID=UPI002AB669A3|nr:uncharacterized protein LOC133328037 [Musca vetustissima]
MANHQQRQSGNNNNNCVRLIFYLVAFLIYPSPVKFPNTCSAHLIHIDDVGNHEFHGSGLPRTHLPPPLPQPPPPLPVQTPGRELTPAECMVDLTNDLAFRILHYHSILNRNNFAFSPTALMSVLVALFEGSAGKSSTELKNVLQFPSNRDIIRVGYRDIHRRLRTYFFGSDNPLKGLSLNKENVTITRDFEAILTFYGYDLGMDMVSSTPPPTTKTSTTIDTTEATTTSTTIATTQISTTTTTTEIKDTTTPTTETITTITTPTTTLSSTTTTTLPTTTEAVTTTPDTSTETTNEAVPTTTTIVDTTSPDETTTATPVAVSTDEAAELISSFVAETNSEPLSRIIQQARVTRLPSAKLQVPSLMKAPQTTYLPAQRKSKRLSAENRRKRHLFGLKDFDSHYFVNLLNSEPFIHSLTPIAALNTPPHTSYVPLTNDYEVEADPNFINSSPAALKQNYNTDVITHVFYLSSQQIIYTTFKVYNAVLYYKYFEHMRLSVLELELDTPEYNLIILLPDYNSDLVAAAASLRSGPKLRLMRKQLKPKWVQAIIPDFKLHGTIFLTNDLQNLGIYDIFEPNRADFRPMTDETGTYVKHIEQTINVHIRTHPINQLRRNSGAQAQPTHISVNHPFMFFVIDRDLDVAVMSGRILNPLNVRIQ